MLGNCIPVLVIFASWCYRMWQTPTSVGWYWSIRTAKTYRWTRHANTIWILRTSSRHVRENFVRRVCHDQLVRDNPITMRSSRYRVSICRYFIVFLQSVIERWQIVSPHSCLTRIAFKQQAVYLNFLLLFQYSSYTCESCVRRFFGFCWVCNFFFFCIKRNNRFFYAALKERKYFVISDIERR